MVATWSKTAWCAVVVLALGLATSGCSSKSSKPTPIDGTNHTWFPIGVGQAHALGAAAGTGPIACESCHGTTTDSFKQVSCTGCHEHQTGPMIEKHGNDMAALGYRFETAACLSCHPASEKVGTLEHEKAFPIAAGTKHGAKGLGCADCHADRQDRKNILCITCHQPTSATDSREVHGEARMAERHSNGALQGYAWESRSCFLCHQRSQVPGVLDHTKYFPIDAASLHPLGQAIDTPAVTVACTTCHQDPSNQKNVSCTDCHAHQQAQMDPKHQGFPGYDWNSRSCVFCHLGGAKKLDHPFFPVAKGSSHALDDLATVPKEGLGCGECHASQEDRKALACTGCHEHTAPESTIDHGASMANHGYLYDSAACFKCHRTSQVPGVFDHDPLYKLSPPSGKGKHQSLQCIDCHASKEDRKGTLQCTVCHQATSVTDAREVHGQPRMDEVHRALTGYAWSPKVCVGCHTDGTKESALKTLNHTWFPIGSGTTHALKANAGQLECASCHTTPGDYTKAKVACLTCHQLKDDQDGKGSREVHSQPRLTDKHVGVAGYAYDSGSCLGCHPQGQKTGAINHTQFPIAMGTKHQNIACGTCHLGTGPKTDLTQLACLGCHQQTVNLNPTVAQIHNGVPNFVAASASCYGCHPKSEKVGPMEHSKFFPIAAGSKHGSAAYLAKVGPTETSCSACHASRVDRTQEKCAECHASVNPTLATAHSRVRDYVNASKDCKACHADSQLYRLTSHGAFSATHEGSTCRECHSNLQACLANATCSASSQVTGGRNTLVTTATRVDKPWAVDFKQYACLKCHQHRRATEESRHQGKSRNGFTFQTYASPGCAVCH